MQRSSSIFNFDQIRVWGRLFSRQQIYFLICCAVLLALPLFLLDKLHLLAVLVLWLIVWTATWKWCRHYRRHLLGFTALLPALAFAGELLFRFHYFGVEGLSFDRYRPAGYAHPWSNFKYSEETYTGLQPNQTLLFKGTVFKVNNMGLRGRDVTLEKPPGVYRIVLLGASVSLGSGVGEDEGVFAILEKRLNEAIGEPRIEVINLSMGAADMANMVHALRHAGMAYDPDMIVFLIDKSGIKPGRFEEMPRGVKGLKVPLWRLVCEPKYEFFSSRFYFPRAVLSQFTALRLWLSRGMLSTRNIRRARARDEFHEGLQEEKQVSRQKGGSNRAYVEEAVSRVHEIAGDIPVVLYTMRPFPRFLDDLAQRYDMRVLLPPEGFLEKYKPAQLIIYPGDPHPNAFAHQLFADAYYEELLKAVGDSLGKQQTDG